MALSEVPETTVTYEQLIQLEYEFNDAEDEILRHSYKIEAPLYERRSSLVAKIPNFWALVLEQAPPEVDQYIQPSDSQVFAECLKNISVDRFEIDTVPKSFSLKFEFSDNEWFTDKVLEKKFYYRRSSDNWTGHVSEPVKVNWKSEKNDLTKGLTDAALKLWQAKAKSASAPTNGKSAAKPLKEHTDLAKKLERHDPTAAGFFTLFAFVSERRYVTAEESVKANAAEKTRRAKQLAGEEGEPPEEEAESDDAEVEVCPFGADLALIILEDVWPNAIKYFTQAQEVDDEQLSELDFEEIDDDSDMEVDIRSLVKGNGSKRKEKSSDGGSPPPKARKV
ncbi:hypothetical protein Vi05172_g5531 [Venturia inaequalis]|nr:hypothetical protein Vi05172_g5531 [Venturia inaequalis]